MGALCAELSPWEVAVSESSEESRELMRRITTEIWDNGRIELVDELIAEDLIDHIEMPGLEGRGRERYRASVLMMRTAFPDFRNPLDLIVAEGDIAVSYGRMVGTNSGQMMGMPPTGRTMDVLVIGMLRFRDGQAIERWGVNDTMAMSQQLGLLG
jgi:predicted ester cyclase